MDFQIIYDNIKNIRYYCKNKINELINYSSSLTH